MIIDKFGFDYALLNIPIVFLMTFTISYFMTFVMSKIPVLKKVV
jgi:surface polysaccharide O-acyltransferase-like enzyme